LQRIYQKVCRYLFNLPLALNARRPSISIATNHLRAKIKRPHKKWRIIANPPICLLKKKLSSDQFQGGSAGGKEGENNHPPIKKINF